MSLSLLPLLRLPANQRNRVRPFTIREAAQLTKSDDSPLFLGDGSLAGVPTPKLSVKGIRPVIKVVDEKCLSVASKFC
jgi:hypothetical protein